MRTDGALAAHAERYFLRPYNPHELAAVERTLLHTLERISAKKQRCALLCWRTERSRRTERCTPSEYPFAAAGPPRPGGPECECHCAAQSLSHGPQDMCHGRNTAADVAR